jgi:flavin reductase (DIM6/NTAB) family NADH-FMN oxidoreductase RutF
MPRLPVTPDAVKAVHRMFPSGVTVVTTSTEGGGPRGLAVNAFASLSVEPPLLLVCILFRGRGFAVNILASTQAAVARRFATSGGDKFADVEWAPGAHGAPILRDVSGYLEAETVSRAIAATHTVFVGRVLNARAFARPPLVYLDGTLYGAEGLQPAEPTPDGSRTRGGTP